MVVPEESVSAQSVSAQSAPPQSSSAQAGPAQSVDEVSAVEPRIVGRYALFDEIAAGGMATIHLGRLMGSTGFSRTVAIKTLHPQFARDPEFVEMFLQEARLASRIQHPNVISTLDRTIDNGEAFLVMEYVAGESLAKLVRASLKKGRQVPNGVAVSILAGTLHGLHATHEARNENREPMHIVHRDVSPQNILVGLDGVARIFDFGVAKAAAMKSQATADGQMKGKLSYMSPEQLNSKSVDRRTDIFAAGVVAWECVAGRRLFSGSDPGEVLAKVLTLDIPSPRDFQPNIPNPLSDAIMKSLARDPKDRWQTAKDFAIALEGTGQLAPGHVVGEWVERYASEALQERRLRVESVERASMQLEAIAPPSSPASSSSDAAGSIVASRVPAGSGGNSEPAAGLTHQGSATNAGDAGPSTGSHGAAADPVNTRNSAARRASSRQTNTAQAASLSVTAPPAPTRRGYHRQLWTTLLVGTLLAASIAGGVWYRQYNAKGRSNEGKHNASKSNAMVPNTALPTADLYYRGEQDSENPPANQTPRSPQALDEENIEGNPDGLETTTGTKNAPPVVEAKDLPEQPAVGVLDADPSLAEAEAEAAKVPARSKKLSPVVKTRKSAQTHRLKIKSKKRRAAEKRRAALAARRALARQKKNRNPKTKPASVSLQRPPSSEKKVTCQPPTYVDKNGIQRIKPQCM